VPTGAINVKKYGVIGDGLTDISTALQNLINSIPAGVYSVHNPAGGVLFYFPAGTYLVNKTVDFSRLETFGIIGDVTSAGQSASILKSNTANMAVVSVDFANSVNDTGTFQIRNMQFAGSTNGGTGLYSTNTVNKSVINCTFRGHIGYNDESSFGGAIVSSQFLGASGSIGLFEFGATSTRVDRCDFSNCRAGLQAAGTGVEVTNSTFEKDVIGAWLGVNLSGGNASIGRSSWQNLSFTDNNTAMNLQSVGSDLFSNISIQGTANGPYGQSQYGLYMTYVGGTTLSGITVNGGFSKAAVYLYNGANSTFCNMTVTNSISTAAIWYSAPGLIGVPANQITVNRAAQPIKTISVLGPAVLQPVNVNDVPASQVASSPQNVVVDVTQHGVLGDRKTDDTAALQALINASAPGTIFYFPRGVYIVSATIDFSRLSSFSIVGDAAAVAGGYNGSTITGGFSGTLINVDYGSSAGTFHISNINIEQGIGGVGLYARNAVLSSIQNAEFTGHVAMYLENPFKVSIQSVDFPGGFPTTDIALQINGGYGCTLENGDFLGWGEGLRIGGATAFAVYSSRFESNNIGMNLGIDPAGNVSTITGCSFQGISMEANNYHIVAASCRNSLFAAIGTQGSTNAPAGLSIIGMQVQDVHDSTFASIAMGGAYSNTAQRVLSIGTNLLFTDCSAWNGSQSGLVGPYLPTVNLLSTINLQPTITGTWDYAGATLLQVKLAGTTYTLGIDPQLTSDSSGNWTLAMSTSLPIRTYDVKVHTADAAGVVADLNSVGAVIIL
jgi:hypothetical protein